MYVNPEIVIPNYFELDQLPYIKVESLNLETDLTATRMLSIRNISYKYNNMIAKIFAFWPIATPSPEKQKAASIKMTLLTEMPVLTLENLTYIITQLHEAKQLQQHEWNDLITLVQHFKTQSIKFVDYVLMTNHQIRLAGPKNLSFNVYYCVKDDCFRLKAALKVLNFQISPLMDQIKNTFEGANGFELKNQALRAQLTSKLNEKLINYAKRRYQQEDQQKTRQKIVKFYERELKKVDETLLELKLEANYPMLREKVFLPIQFTDGYDDQPLVEPIISNKNQNCMYSHFTGYNSNNYNTLQNSYCKYCGILIKQMQENKLMMFLRNNLFNPTNSAILYCPEFNRFKILSRVSEEEIARRKLAQLRLTEPKQQDPDQEIDEEVSIAQNTEMKNEIDAKQESMRLDSPETEIGFTNFMHFCLTVKNMYPLTKNRLKIEPRKQVEYVPYVYELYSTQAKPAWVRHFQKFQLMDPGRGKFCTHLEFADLRLFYKSCQKKSTLFCSENVYRCPICDEQVKDSELIYLKQTLVLIKFIRSLLEPVPEDEVFQSKTQKRVDRNSIRIIINNVEKRVFVEYVEQDKKEVRKQWQQIEKFYPTLVDPYIHFSEYSLGLNKRNRKANPLYNFGNVEPEQISSQIEKQWYGGSENSSSFSV